MPVMTPVSPDDPLMVAWMAYKLTEEFTNTRKWALFDEHVDGSLWAAFFSGYMARTPPDVSTLVTDALAQAVKERDEAEGWLASLSDAINGWLREEHLDHLQTQGYRGPEIREAINQLGYAFNKQAEEIARLRAAAAQEVWDSVPASYNPNDAVVLRHARALNDLAEALRARPSEPQGDEV